ncbi:signal transduction histidine kinase [Methanobacterium lacus]|uniref:histidine kinase n=1 Tax=Methanobacterium lacus (strain AL-21) TaxID=877455 RepID=F0T5V2_METLA|nr:histidine kinase dimerization/phosphoacceptor domain -containing protein [Methanobacterium lacus]ADZ09345.1 signal transduction histidine kinase [Methanobacterium lacus]
MEPIRILLVEDVELDAELTERELKRTNLNYVSKRVEEESDFIDLLKSFKPDIILADHSLPNFDGVTALKITKEKCPETPFIFVSGKIGEDFAVEMLKEGATDYVLKSNLPKLGHAVQRALKEFNEQVELKFAQEALLESENKYRTLFEKNKHPIIVFDDKGNFTDSNEAALMFMETNKEHLLTKNLSDVILYSDDVETIGSEEFWNKKDNLEVTFEIKGKLKILELTLTPVYLNTETIVFGVGTDITKRKIDEEKILNSLKEKELLLREIHHRVKNNLQIISTLLTLQSSQNNNVNVDDLYRESQNRIQSISLIHENLYHSKDLANINFEIYAKGLIMDLFDSYGMDSQKVRLNLDIDNITMGIETAIPCGLIINELVSNSLKHGFSDFKTGEVNVKLHRIQDGKFSLVISDTGRPFPENINLVNNETLGLELIKNLVNQLDAQLKFDRDKKEFNIIFKELEYKERI